MNIVSCCDRQFGSIFFICMLHVYFLYGIIIFFFVSRSKVKCSSETLVQSYIKRILAKDIEIRIG